MKSRLAILPALNEEAAIARVVDEIRAADPGFEILVIDDGSTDAHRRGRPAAGARVVRLPFNLGIGGAVQTGYQYALEHGYDIAVQIDADGQHDPGELAQLARSDRSATRPTWSSARASRWATLPSRRWRAGSGSALFARRRADHRAAHNRPDLGLPRVQPPRHPALRRRLPARLPGGRGQRAGRAAQAAAARGAGARCAPARRAAPRSPRSRSLYYMIKVLLALFVACSAATPLWRTETPLRVSIVAAIAAIILLAVIFELIRSRRLQERYALLWLATGGVILFFALWRGALGRFADLVGIATRRRRSSWSRRSSSSSFCCITRP